MGKTALTFSKDNVKKLLVCFGLAFLLVFVILAVNQYFLLIGFFKKNQESFSQGIVLFLHTLPAAVVMSIPFAVCTGFVYGLIKMDFAEKLSQNKKNGIAVLVLGLIIAVLAFVIYDFAVPSSNKNFNELFRTISDKENILAETPREMGSITLLQGIDKIRGDRTLLNIYNLELHKKYSIPLGALFFSFFALSLSLVFNKHLKAALCTVFLSCVAYWAFLTYGEMFSLNYKKFAVLATWFPNIFFLCISIILCVLKYRVFKETPKRG